MNREQINEYYVKKYHENKEKNKQTNLLKYGNTRSPSQLEAKAKYLDKNRDKFRKLNKQYMRQAYERKNLETLTLRAVRKLFVE